MKDRLLATDISKLLRQLETDLLKAEPELTALDSVIGDGDLGMTLTIGFKAIEESIPEPEARAVSEILIDSSEAFAEVAASTFGTLLTVMLKKAGAAVKKTDEIGTAEMAMMFEAAVKEVQRRGKAQLGDKTLLDALIPAEKILKQAAENGEPLGRAMTAAAEAAEQGAEKTIGMKAKVGRSGYLGDRTIGQKDPGATAMAVMIRSAARYITS